MLQFIAEQSNNLSIAEQVKMAIDGGCAWVQLRTADASDDDVRSIAAEIVPLCREHGIILTIEDRADLAKELGLHGVHLTDSTANARQMRQDLGAEAIIGINVTSPQGIPTLEKLDIDYATISPELTLGQVKELVETVRSVGCKMPLVLTRDFNCFDINIIRETGVSGVATGKKLIADANPSEAIKQLIAALQQ